MRFYLKFIILIPAIFFLACGGESKPSTPFETLKAYTTAIKKKDTTTMKLLLSKDSIKMAEQEAKAQGVTLDEVVKRETLFNESQSTVEFRNEKIDGDKATIEMKDSFSSWNSVPFVREEGSWKIDKQGVANQMMQDFEQNNKRLDDIINQGRQPWESVNAQGESGKNKMKIYQTMIIALGALFVFGCNAEQKTGSPTETLKTFLEASRKKDVETVKKTLSRTTLETAEKSAREHNTTVDALLKKGDVQISDEIPEIRNEKIEGDAATVEIKDAANGYETLPFVKEDGNWKIAFDKYQELMQKKLLQEEVADED